MNKITFGLLIAASVLRLHAGRVFLFCSYGAQLIGNKNRGNSDLNQIDTKIHIIEDNIH